MQDIIKRAKAVMKQPRAFFKKLKESGVKPAFRYYAVLSAVQLVLALIVSTVFSSKMGPLANLPAGASFSVLLVSLAMGYVFGLAGSFVGAGVLHLYILLLGGKPGYPKTYQLTSYASTPSMLLGWIPLASLIGSIWTLVLFIVGVQEVHKFSQKKAIVMFVIPVVILFVLGLLFASVAMSLFGMSPLR